MTGIFYVLLRQHGGGTDTEIRVSTESRPWRRKFSRRSSRDSNPRPFNHESGALTTELSPPPEFVNLYFPYAGQGLSFFHWWQWHFKFQLACVAVEGRSSVVLNMHAQCQISQPKRFLSLSHYASQCAFGDGVCWLLV